MSGVTEIRITGALCRGCGQMLPPDQFTLDRNAKARNGLAYRCVECKRKANRAALRRLTAWRSPAP